MPGLSVNWVWTNAGFMLPAPSQPLLAHYSLAFFTLFNQTQSINFVWKELPPPPPTHTPTSPHWFYILLEAKANFQDSGQHQFQILSASWKRKLWKRHLTFFFPSTWGKIWKLLAFQGNRILKNNNNSNNNKNAPTSLALCNSILSSSSNLL